MNPAWKTCKLGNVCTTICSGGTPSALKSEYYEGGTIPWLNTSEIDFGPISSTQRYITESGLAHSAAKWIPKHTVIVAMYGATAGRVAYTECPITTNQACCNLVVDPSVAHYKYVYYSLVKQYNYVKSLANGGAQQNLNAEKIKNLPLVLPPLADQERIAGVLGAYDELIAVNERRMALLEKAAHRLWRDRFVSHADPAWPRRPLGEVAKFLKGKTITGTKARPGTIPVVAGGTEPAYYHDSANTKAPVLTVSASGTAGFTRIYYEDIWASDCSYLDGAMGVPLFFVYCFLKANRGMVENLKRGAAQPHVYTSDLNALEGRFDETSVQAFEAQVSPCFEAIGVLARENALLRLGRDGLLPRLLRGEA